MKRPLIKIRATKKVHMNALANRWKYRRNWGISPEIVTFDFPPKVYRPSIPVELPE
jgi:hypothetical protein